jgi:hypothetical protein
MRTVVAPGGNALLRRGERASIDAQRANIRGAALQLAKVAAGNSLVGGPRQRTASRSACFARHGRSRIRALPT